MVERDWRREWGELSRGEKWGDQGDWRVGRGGLGGTQVMGEGRD